jgi:predicted nucleic acid-binding protein
VILIDTSIWIDHFRKGDLELERLLRESDVLIHPFVIGELALGYVDRHTEAFRVLHTLLSAVVATDFEVLELIESEQLAGSGIGYLDAHLLASVKLTPGARLWSRDKKLNMAAERLGLSR